MYGPGDFIANIFNKERWISVKVSRYGDCLCKEFFSLFDEEPGYLPICLETFSQAYVEPVEDMFDSHSVIDLRHLTLLIASIMTKNRRNRDRSLEMETWHDLANVYSSLSQWRDAEVCLSKSKAINPYSASRWHSTGLLYEAKGLHRDALQSFENALNIEPGYGPSLLSTALVLKQLSGQSLPVVKSFLTDALRVDRTNPCAWYNLGLLYKADIGASAVEAAECFEAAALLQESAPVEPFR